jgi:hypothetical protein
MPVWVIAIIVVAVLALGAGVGFFVWRRRGQGKLDDAQVKAEAGSNAGASGLSSTVVQGANGAGGEGTDVQTNVKIGVTKEPDETVSLTIILFLLWCIVERTLYVELLFINGFHRYFFIIILEQTQRAIHKR